MISKAAFSWAVLLYTSATNAQPLDITNAQPLNIANPTNTTAAPPCTSPNGYANDIVFAPNALATVNHRIADSFVNAHTIYYLPIQQTFLSQASIASFCLKRCISYQTNATGNVPCLSFSVDMGRPDPPVANDIELRWYCTAFDALLTPDLYEAVELGVESHMYAVGVNRLCEGTYQAY